jgi:hypothetical protein
VAYGLAMTFGERLRHIREGRGVSRDWIPIKARELGFPNPVSRQCIKSLELGRSKTPQNITLVQLRAIFPELGR